MIEFRCQSGPLRITVLAETAHEAALEAIAWWGPRSKRYRNDGLGAAHRRSLDEMMIVEEVPSFDGGFDRFSTFELIAESEGRLASEEWNKLLDWFVGGEN